MATYRWLILCAAIGITLLEVGLFAAASSVTPGAAAPTVAAAIHH